VTFESSDLDADIIPTKGRAPLPMFLGIGAQRSGSTWLHQNLSAHRGIWLPPTKELHYFNELRGEPFFCRRYRKKLRSRIGSVKNSLLRGEFEWSPADFMWDMKYFFLPRSDRWYSELFSQGRHLVAGEITPAYSALSTEVVASIKNINPKMKVIFLMRDPIDRSWSHARKELPSLYGRPLEEIPRDKVIRWFSEPLCALRSDYMRTLDTWLAHFPAKQFFFGFLDEIMSDPINFLLRVYDFLGVDKANKHLPDTAHAVVNARKKVVIAPEYEYELAKIHEPKLARLKEMFDSYPSQWHERCIRILNEQS
jgi:Sulfotransferase family